MSFCFTIVAIISYFSYLSVFCIKKNLFLFIYLLITVYIYQYIYLFVFLQSYFSHFVTFISSVHISCLNIFCLILFMSLHIYIMPQTHFLPLSAGFRLQRLHHLWREEYTTKVVNLYTQYNHDVYMLTL